MPYYPPASAAGVTSPVATDPLTFSGAVTFTKSAKLNTTGSSTSTPRGLYFQDVGSGEAWRIGAGSGSPPTAFAGGAQGGNGQRTQMFSYYGIELVGTRQDTSALAYTAGGATDAGVSVINLTAGAKGLIVKSATSQSVNIFEAQDSSASPVWGIDSAGLPSFPVAGNAQTTVGAAGGASALPATPTKYFKVKDSAGTTLVIPAYAAS